MKKLIIFLVKVYKKLISPIFENWGIQCKYRPTCSEYVVQAVEKYGVFKGCLLGVKRILKCNPFYKGGYDPLKWQGGK